MTRDDAIARLRRQMPLLSRFGITGLWLTGPTARGETEPTDDLDVVLDIRLQAHPEFSMFTLAEIKVELEDELGITVWPLVLDGMRQEGRAAVERDLVRIT